MANGRDVLVTRDADGGSHTLPVARVSDLSYVGRDTVVVLDDEERGSFRQALATAKAGQVRAEFSSVFDRKLVLAGVGTGIVAGVGALIVEVIRMVLGR